MPHIPIIALILIARAILYAVQNDAAPQTPTPPGTMGTTVPLLVWVIGGAIVAGLWIATLGGMLFLLPIDVVATLAMFPWPVARWIAVPLGWYRTAYYVASTSTVVWRLDYVGGGLVAGARALLRADRIDPDDLRWLESRLESVRPVLPGALLAAGLLAWARGDRTGARRLVASIGWYRPDRIPDAAWSMAREWLAMDAAMEGDWEKVERLTRRDGRPRSRATVLLAGVARRLLHTDSAPSDNALWATWALAPGHAATRPLVERALAAPQPAQATPVADAGPDALENALRAHARVARREAPTKGDLAHLAAAWDRLAADASFPARVERRAAEIGARAALSSAAGDPRTPATARFFDEVRDEIAQFAEKGGVALHEIGGDAGTGLLAAVVRRTRDDAMNQVELAAAAMNRRIADKRELAGIDEAREFLTLTALYDRLGEIGGVASQRLVFRRVHEPICALAVWLFNEREEKPLANAMFRWLLEAAKKVEDNALIELQTKNTSCGF